MHFFSYGIVANQFKSNTILKRGLDVVSENAWVRGALYDSELGFNVMTYGEDKVEGVLFDADEDAMVIIKGMARNIQSINSELDFVLIPLVVYTENVTYEAQVFIYEVVDGLKKIPGQLN
jgi:gamma-glutamylcyclotransferase (GGCT)/AIG2-like uncharacterized protein YtfP